MSRYKPKQDHDFGKQRRLDEVGYFVYQFYLRKIDIRVTLEPNLFAKIFNPETNKIAYLILCYQGSGGIYISIPVDHRSNVKDYLLHLDSLNHHILVISEDSTEIQRKYSAPLSIVKALKYWNGSMGTGENDHKYIFGGPVSQIDFQVLEDPELLDKEQTILNQIIRLVQ